MLQTTTSPPVTLDENPTAYIDYLNIECLFKTGLDLMEFMGVLEDCCLEQWTPDMQETLHMLAPHLGLTEHE